MSVVRSLELRKKALTAACVKSGSLRSRLRITRTLTNTSWPNNSSISVRSSTGCFFGSRGDSCVLCIAIDGEEWADGEAGVDGLESGRAGLLVAQPQVPSTSALIEAQAARRTRPLIGVLARSARTGTAMYLVTVARVLINVILPGQWVQARRSSHRSPC